jgi:hypothetical protein
MPIEVVQPGSADDPFTNGASQADPAGASQGVPAGTVADSQPGAAQTDPQDASAEAAKATAAATATGADPTAESEDLSPDEEAALDIFFQHRLETEVLPKWQSSVDRRIAGVEAAAKRDVAAAVGQANALKEEIRNVKLNGLSPEDQAKLKTTWAAEDKQAELDAYEQQLEGYHRNIVVASYVTNFPHLQLTEEDFAEFKTPEQMEVFIALADREYYKELAARGGQPAVAAAAPAATSSAPAGATAPSDGSSSAAPPPVSKFSTAQDRQAMIDNIGGGWETVQISR